jgi:hypothetical protein
MIQLPLEYQSGTTFLADLNPEYYITNKKHVIAKLTADNAWAKPIQRIAPIDFIELSETKFKELNEPYDQLQEYLKTDVAKHLQGQHDQSTHAGKKSYISFDDLGDDGDSIQSAVDELYDSSIGSAANGNVAMRVLLERIGKGGKPQVVKSVEDLDGEPIYRGTTKDNADTFANSNYDRIGRGAMGDGYYFSDSQSTANDYAGQFEGGTTITAGWKKDAKVYDFSVKGKATENNYLDNLIELGGETSGRLWDDWKMSSAATTGQDASFMSFFNDENDAAVTNLILQDYDGMTIKQPSGETYTIAFNREAMQVVAN